MNTLSTSLRPLLVRVLALSWALCSIGAARAQHVKHWVGGSGAWSDAHHWAATADGPGGAGAPRSGEQAVIAPMGTAIAVELDKDAQLAGLTVDGTHAGVTLSGHDDLRITGDLRTRGTVHWYSTGPITLDLRGGLAELDLRGIPLAGDVSFTGGGTWSLLSDLVLHDGRHLSLEEGTVVTNGNLLRAGALVFEGHQEKRLVANTSVVMVGSFEPNGNTGVVDVGESRLVLDGEPADWGEAGNGAEAQLRAINICGTNPGQTMFTINAQLLSNYNGFGVSCPDLCNATVRVTITGGSGNFAIQWLSGGPTTATWTTACKGTRVVVVTDVTQGITCATSVAVTDPGDMSAAFFGAVPPTCAQVCDGRLTAFALGGVPPYIYDWNSGSGSGDTYNGLCPGENTLHITDANNCVFDTTFTFDVSPVVPVLTSGDASCFGDCNGTASLSVTGGTGTYSFDWQPGNPTGDGTTSVSQLCAGNYSVTVADANGCDTTLTFTIAAPPAIIPNASHVDATCWNECNGTATVAPTGAVGPFSYTWAPAPGGGQGTPAATGLCAGTYTCTIVDTPSGCDTLVSFTILAPPAIDPQPSSTAPLCANSCDGEATVSPTGGTPGYTYLWTPAPPTGQGTPSATGLCAGTWTVLVGDAAGCDTLVTFELTDPPPIDPVPAHTDVTCAGDCDGTATVSPTGGTPGYTYLWTPAPPAGQGTPNATGLCAGAWSVLVADANGCDTLVQFTILEPLPLQAVPTQTNVTCGSNCDGTASVAVTGGTGTYDYLWTPAPAAGQGTPNATGLCAGPIDVLITDDNGCTLTQSFTILAAVPLQLSLNTAPASCPGVCDGTAGVIVTGGSPGYTYAWSPAPGAGQGTPNVTGLCPQAYSLTVTDALGCDSTISFTITAPAPILTNEVVTNATCFGDCDGSIVLAPTGGSGGFTYLWSPVPANGQGQPQATGLCAGTYQVIVTSGACDTTLSITITSPTAIDPGLVTTPVACAGDCDGTATANASGGTPGYTYLWTPAPGAGQGTPTATALCPGSYSLTITDAAGCDTIVPFSITAPPPIVPDLVLTGSDCGAACNGTASVTPTGGTGTFTYEWEPGTPSGDGTPSVTGLCSGAYTVTITDAALCDTTIAFVISTPSSIVVAPVVTPASCADVCDGTIVLAPTGGAPPYTYSWTPAPGTGQGTPSVSGLCPGDWIVTVGDQAGCDTTLIINVPSPPAIIPNGVFTDESCFGPCDGTADVSPTGGDGVFTYFWSPAPGTGQGTPSVSGLCAGDYSVLITDGNGCDTLWSFTVSPVVPIAVAIDVQDGLCYGECIGEATVTATGGVGGFTYTWSPGNPAGQGTDHVTGLCMGNYEVVVADAAGCDTTILFTVFKPQPIEPNLVVEGEDCTGPCTGQAAMFPFGGAGGFTYDWQPSPATGQGTDVVTGLCAGTDYQVTVTDANGCDTTLAFTVPAFDPIIPDVTVTPATCATSCDGSAAVTATGGEGPYTFFWVPAPPNGQGVSTATGLCAGAYDLTITDNNGCDTTVQVVITAPPPFDVAATQTEVTCSGACDGTVQLTVSGGTPAYTFTWTPAPPVGQGTGQISGLCPGPWTVLISDANGCDTSITYTITEPLSIAATADVVASHCRICDGSLVVHATGGTGPYTFGWGPPLNVTTPDSTQTGLCAGLYPVLITDAAGCTFTQSFPITDSDGEVLDVTDGVTSCPNTCDGAVSVSFTCSVAPCTVAWFDILGNDLNEPGNALSGLCPGDYLVEVTNGDGCITIDTATVTAPPGLTAAISSSPVSCAELCDGTATIGITGGTGAFTITWTPAPGSGQGTPSVTGLCPGVYDIAVQDAGGCDTTFSVLITAPDTLTADGVVTDITCNGACDGSIVLTAQGGSGAYTYFWSPVPPNGQGTASATGLCAGDYDVLVTDANGCDTALTFTINEPAPIVLSPTATLSHCVVCDGSITLGVTGGTGTVDVTWTDANGDPAGTGTALTGLCAGLYTANATDANGCTAQVVVAITDATGEALTMIDGQTLCANACDAQVGVIFTCSAAPCTITWYDAGANVIAQNTFTVPDLCVGTYIVEVANGAGCTTIDTTFVTPSQTIVPNLSSTPVSCPGECDGTATTGPTGGVDLYTYTWTPEPGGGQGTPQATGLCPGTYQVLIADASGCDTLVSVLILEPSPIQVGATVDDVTCNGSCDGAITLLTSGGNGGFTYTWAPEPPGGQGTPAITDLCAGDWSVLIADANGCDTSITYTIAEPAALTLDITTTDSDCGVCNGTASVQPAGGTQPYSYSWSQGVLVHSTDNEATGLCAGLYTLTVTDANNCVAQVQVPISDGNGETVTTTGDLLDCPGQCDGEVSASFACGVPACTVAWFDGAGNDLGQSGTTLSNLCAGLYFVEVVNGSGCTTIDSARVSEPEPITANLSTTPPSCHGDCDGTATVGPTGGAGGYDYLWSPEPAGGQGTPQATGLCTGAYSVIITDANGCSIVQDVLLTEPDRLDATAVLGMITCNGACDGSLTVLPTGGTGDYAFLWSPEPDAGQGTATATGLCAGDWNVTITDDNGCDSTFTIPVPEPPVLVTDLTTVDNACSGDCAGSASVAISGGAPDYGILWEDAANNILGVDVTSISGLCAGDYTLTVTDANGCERELPFTITEGAALIADLVITQETCNGPCDGTATVSPGGGSGSGYAIVWSPDPGVGQGTPSISGLCAGDYTVTITDGGGCDTTIAFTIDPYQHMDLNGVILAPTCNGACDGSIDLTLQGGAGGYTYLWSPEPPAGQGTATVTGLCALAWSVTITDAVMCDTTITITLVDPPAITVTLDGLTDASCSSASDGALSVTIGGGTPGYSIGWTGPGSFGSSDEDITGLAPGDYTLTVTDANGCATTQTWTVGALTSVIADAGAPSVVCSGDGIPLDGSASQGGTAYEWTDEQNDIVGTEAVVLLGALPAGTYTFTLTVSDGPCAASDDVTITVLPTPDADAGPDQELFVQGEVTLGGQPSGPPGSTFSWTPDTLLNDPAAGNPIASVSTTTWFVLTVVNPDGCVAVDSVLITVFPEVEIPSGFTPNGDGYNDTWQIDFIDLFPDCEVEIYNRWGQPLFRSVGYNIPWDGTYNGGLVPVGTYYYAIQLNDPRFPEAFTGPLTVIR